MVECSIDTENCGGMCTGYDGSKEWQKIHAAVEDIGCETCRDEGRKLMTFTHDVVNARLGKPIYDKKNFHEFVEIVNCTANKCKMDGRC